MYMSLDVRQAGRRGRRAALLALVLGVVLVACTSPAQPQGSLEVTVGGLAAGIDARVTVTGPASFSRVLSASATLEGLSPGDYTISAGAAQNYFVASATTQQVAVVANMKEAVSVEYAKAFDLMLSPGSAEVTLSGAADVALALHNVHPLLSGGVSVSMALPSDWVASDSGPWSMQEASAPVTLTLADGGADVGLHEVIFGAQATAAGQLLTSGWTLELNVQPLVTSLADDATAPQPGMLRYLIGDPRSEGRTISFASSALQDAAPTIVLDGVLEVEQSLVIKGPTAPNPLVTLSGNGSSRILTVRQPGTGSVEVELSRLRFTRGWHASQGGAIRVEGDLTVRDSVLESNGSQDGGAIMAAYGSTLTVVDSLFFENEASRYGGAVWADNRTDVRLEGSSFANNTAQNGGAIMVGQGANTLPENRASLEVLSSEIIHNQASDGGGLMSYAVAAISGTIINDNTASDGGGGLRNHYVMTMIDSEVANNSALRYGGLLSDGIMHIENSDITDNEAANGDGGGIYNGFAGDFLLAGNVKQMTIVNSRVSNNYASGTGGGVHNVQFLSVEGSTIHGNESGMSGGGIFSRAHAGSEPDRLRGHVSVSGSTLSYNRSGADGGGVAMLADDAEVKPELTLVNSTVASNEAAGYGGGVSLWLESAGFGEDGPSATVHHVTIADNLAVLGGGGVYTRYAPWLSRATIIADNGSLNLNEFERDLAAFAGRVTFDGYNWIGVAPQPAPTAQPTDVQGQLAAIGALADNGGPTRTVMVTNQMQLVPLGECVDLSGQPLLIDQRGQPRGLGGTCYVGAVEP